jgi:hypothetical protein
MEHDPHANVVAPVQSALTGLVVRGLALVGAIGFLAVWTAAAHPEPAASDAAAFLGVALLATYTIVARGLRAVRGRPSLEERQIAWERAQELSGNDTALGLLVVAWVPAAVFLAMAVLFWPHMTDVNPQIASAWVVLAMPPAAMAWMLMVATWLDAARDDLARAEHESDVRFRTYWANLGR